MRILTSICLALLVVDSAAVELDQVRMWPAPDNTRVVFDISDSLDYRIFTMRNPDRVVIDMVGTRLRGPLAQPQENARLLKRVRSAPHPDHLRVVLDLHQPVQLDSSVLGPNGEYGHRLVVDLIAPEAPAKQAPAKPPTPTIKLKPKQRVVKSDQEPAPRHRDIVIAIDPGHGGADPGATGAKKTLEKDIVLAIAKELKAVVDAERGMRAVLVRDGDYLVRLRDRMGAARKARADLFISIHADAFKDNRVRGSSVYVLSQRGASSEAARFLAEKENAADYIGGVPLDDKDNVLKWVLLDLSQTAALAASLDVGDRVLQQLRRLGPVHKKKVQHAGFVVLKSPDIPSILIETAYISNPSEEAKLRSESYRRQMARAIMTGVREYFTDSPPAGTLLASRKHRISSGETLSGIALRYEVSTERLKLANNLPNDSLRAGDELLIP